MMVDNLNFKRKTLGLIEIQFSRKRTCVHEYPYKEHSLNVVVEQNKIEENEIMIVIYNRH